MKEEFETTLHNQAIIEDEKRPIPRRELSALRNDWLKENGINLEGKSFGDLQEVIRDFYNENSDFFKEQLEQKGASLDEDLTRLVRKKLDHKDFAKIRKKLNLPKWVSLAEAVAFIKTTLDTDLEDIKGKYTEYCATSLSLDDMRRVLAFDNDVKPARLDTDIYHQSPERSRSAVEIVSNAVDAVNPTETTIGRFGVGFYQILSHLKSDKDYIKVTTGNEEEGFYRIHFRLHGKEIQIHLESTEDTKTKGTTVELVSEDFPKEEAEALVRKHFAYNNVADIYCNGELVNDLGDFEVSKKEKPSVRIDTTEKGYVVQDDGAGMGPQVVLEKLIVPKYSGKRPIYELVDREKIDASYFVEERNDGDFEPGKAVINIGGVMIEEVETSGINTPKTLVIDLPPFTTLGEERNRVAIDEVTILAIKKVIDKITSSKDVALMNAIAPVAAAFQRRSLHHEKDNNLISHLQKQAERVLEKELSYLPNTEGFERLKLDNIKLVNPYVKQTNWNKVEGLKMPKLTGNGSPIYVAPLQEKVDQPVITSGNRYIFDEKLYEELQEDPTLINLYIEAYKKGIGADIRKFDYKQEITEISPRVESAGERYKSFADYVVNNWQLLGFPNKDTAEIDIEKLVQKREKEAQIIYKHIISKFPEEISKTFVGFLLGDIRDSQLNKYLEETNFEKVMSDISSISQNPELVKTLATLGIRLAFYGEPEHKPFEDINHKRRDQVKTNDPDHTWYRLHYWDRENLVAPDGEVFRGEPPFYGEMGEKSQPTYSTRGNLFGFTPLRVDQGKTLRFLDAKTKQFRSVDFPFIEKRGIEGIQFGDKRLLFIHKGSESMSFKERKPLYQYMPGQLYDFDTGEEFNPAPHLGAPIGIIEERGVIVFHKPSENFYTEAEHQFYFKDGTEMGRSEFNELLEDEEKRKTEGAYIKVRGAKGDYWSGKRGWGELYINDQYVHSSPELPPFAPKKELNEDSLDFKIIKDSGKKYVFWNFTFKKGPGDENNIEHENILFDEEGNKIWQLQPNEKAFVHQQTADGGATFRVYGPAKERYFIDMACNRINGEALKDVEPVVFYNKETEHSTGAVSPYQGETWAVQVDTFDYYYKGRRSYRSKEETMQKEMRGAIIQDKETGENILGPYLNSVIYNPQNNTWECTALLPITQENERGKNEEFYRIFTIDSRGAVLKEQLQGKRDRHYYSSFVEGKEWEEEDLIREMESLSFQKTEIMNREIEGFEFQDRMDVERFVGRCLKYGNLDDETFAKIAPAMLRIEYMHPSIVTDKRIENIEAQLRELDEDTRVWCYSFLSRLLSQEATDENIDIFIDKFLKIYRDKIAHRPEQDKKIIFDAFGERRDYKEQYIASGWTIVQHKTPVPMEMVPENIRPIVDFLTSEEGSSLSEGHEPVAFTGQTRTSLSQLIQTKRLNERMMQRFNGSAEDLVEMVREKTKDKKQEHIQREIIHPVYYQSVDNPYLYIRELVQNAHDAAVRSGEEEEKTVTIDIFSRTEDETTVRIEDKVGMSMREVLNYFLIPGETTKLEEKESIGYFGQGLFTLFRDSKEVVLKTGIGDGTVTKLRITPSYGESGLIVDLNLDIEQAQENFKGTVVEKTVATNMPTVEAAYVKNASNTYTSLVDRNAVTISLNGRELNRPQQTLASVEMPGMGTLTMYDAPNNVVTQRGLFIKAADDDFKTDLYDVEKLLTNRGIVINIPDNIDLTRSRNEIARKQEVVPKLQEQLPLLKLKAYLEIFRQDILRGQVIQLDNLPYDYFHWDYPSRGKIVEDAKKLREGSPITDIEEYKERGSLIQLLVLLPVVELDNKSWSLAELKEAALRDKPPLENQNKYYQLPGIIREKLLEGKKEYSRHRAGRERQEERGETVGDFTFDEWQKQPEFVRRRISEQRGAYASLNKLSNSLHGVMTKSLEGQPTVQTTFYAEPESAAHASQGFKFMGWNLDHWQRGRMSPFEERNPTDGRLYEFFETYSHEFAHILERSGSFSHNPSFYRKQAEVLSRIMYERREN